MASTDPLQGLFASLRNRPDQGQLSSQAGRQISPNTPLLTSMAPREYASPAPTDQDRTSNLLSLLKFSASSVNNTSGPAAPPSHINPERFNPADSSSTRPGPSAFQRVDNSSAQQYGRGVSASDLVASFAGKPGNTARDSTPTPTNSGRIEATRPTTSTPLSKDHQNFLLNLLNRPQQSLTASPLAQPPSTSVDNLAQHLANSSLSKQSSTGSDERVSPLRNESPIRIFGSEENKETTPFEPQDLPKVEQPLKKQPIFTYVNPFEQLTGSSPRNASKSKSGNVTPSAQPFKPAGSPLSTNGDGHKRKSKEPSPDTAHAHSRRKLTTEGDEVLQSIEVPDPPAVQGNRTQADALMEIGAPSTNPETVAEALNEVGSHVSRQVEQALAQAEEDDREIDIKEEEFEDVIKDVLHTVQEQAQDVAIGVRDELEKDENEGLLEEILPQPMTEAVKDVIDEAAQGLTVKTSDRENELDNGEGERIVQVYNFPMKPFVSIDIIRKETSHLALRGDSILDIARLKKDFDQIDRTLATATTEYIVYGMPKSGGLRIIRQDDGADRQIFRKTNDRIFNVAISTSSMYTQNREIQNVIATGVSGAVYWAPISRPDQEEFSAEDMEEYGLTFQAGESDIHSGGQLKTRSRKSSRHPEFFAIGRGKSIHIVFPEHASTSELVHDRSIRNTEKYFKDRNLKINTGKAGKDFVFSEDDTAIATLDKAGRLRFWDIRDLIKESNATALRVGPIEVKTPLLSFATASPNDKSWPTSVSFVDKARAFEKGIALRYVLVGKKQNHTLQLWDLGLGKAVQELSFPHEKESDAICSVNFHARSSIIVVGHPTRNSIYFIHLSAPRYNISAMTQVKYLQRLANKDASLPRPDATAIMSGMREYSFVTKGQLRSIELIPSSADSAKTADGSDPDPVLFELYVMHSRGVTCLSIRKADLGWSKNSKILHPIDAEKHGDIVVKDLQELPSTSVSEPSSVNGDTAPPLSTPPTKIPTKDKKNGATPSVKVHEEQGDKAKRSTAELNGSGTLNNPSTNNVPKSEKKKKKKAEGAFSGPEIATTSSPASSAPDSYASAAQRAQEQSSEPPKSPAPNAERPHLVKTQSIDAPEAVSPIAKLSAPETVSNKESINVGISGDWLDKELKKIEKGVSGEFSKVLSRELESLYRRFDEDKRVQDAAGAAKQDAILRLVSSTLGDNVEKALSRIIKTNIQQVVVPSISDVTASTLEKKISEVLTHQLHHTIPPQLKLALPEAMSRAIQNPDVLHVLSEQITARVAGHVDVEFAAILKNVISPAFQQLAKITAQKLNTDTERWLSEHLQRAEIQHHDDAAKIDKLGTLVRGLSETVHAMAAAQSDFQQEILKLQKQIMQERQGHSSRAVSTLQAESPIPQKSPEQEELEAITTIMTEGHMEEGIIQVSFLLVHDE